MASAPRRIDSLPTRGSLPRDARIRHRRDFQRIQKRGIRVHTLAFSVVAAPGRGTERARLGCAVSRRVGNAVVRSRIRRLIRETFRRLAVALGSVDIVVIAKPNAASVADRGLAEVAEMLAPAMEKAGRRALGGGS